MWSGSCPPRSAAPPASPPRPRAEALRYAGSVGDALTSATPLRRLKRRTSDGDANAGDFDSAEAIDQAVLEMPRACGRCRLRATAACTRGSPAREWRRPRAAHRIAVAAFGDGVDEVQPLALRKTKMRIGIAVRRFCSPAIWPSAWRNSSNRRTVSRPGFAPASVRTCREEARRRAARRRCRIGCYDGSYPRRYRLTVRTEPSQGSNTGSIPVSATIVSITSR
jgi:hypothetical protein